MILNKNNCKKVKAFEMVKEEGNFIAKPIICIIDEMSEVMENKDYRAVDEINNSIASIARLGRAAACHLCLATQRPSANIINSDIKNNVQLKTLLGDFGSSESTLIFDDDYSSLSKPEIAGRGFIKSGQEVTEYQSFWVDKKTIIYEYKNNFYNSNFKPIKEVENKVVDFNKASNDIEAIVFEKNSSEEKGIYNEYKDLDDSENLNKEEEEEELIINFTKKTNHIKIDLGGD